MLQNAIIKTPIIKLSASVGDGSTEKPVGDGFAMLLGKKPVVSPEKLALVPNSSNNSSPAEKYPTADYPVEESTNLSGKSWPEFSRETPKPTAMGQKSTVVGKLIDGADVNVREMPEKLTVTLVENDSNQATQAPVQTGTATPSSVEKEGLDFPKEWIQSAGAGLNFSTPVEPEISTEEQPTKADAPVNEVKSDVVEPSPFKEEQPQQIILESEQKPIPQPATERPALDVTDSKLARAIVSEVAVQDMDSVFLDLAVSTQEYHPKDEHVVRAETALRMIEVPTVVPIEKVGHAIASGKQAHTMAPAEAIASAFQVKSGDSGKSIPGISSAPPTMTEAGGGHSETRLPIESVKQEVIARDGKPMTTEAQPVAVLRNAPAAKADVPDVGNITALQSDLHADTNAAKHPAVAIFQSVSQPAQTLASAIRENSNWSPSLLSSTAHTTQSVKADGSTLQTMRVQLNPVELGKVDLNLRMQQGQLQIEVRVENDQAHRALLADQEGLFSTLRSLGYKVDNIVINGPGSDNNTQNQSDGQQDEQRFNGEKNERHESGRGYNYKELDHDGYREETSDQDTHSSGNII